MGMGWLWAVVAALAVAGAGLYTAWPFQVDTAALAGQRVAVFGASTGIGRHIALVYAEAGAEVVLVARRRAVLEGVAEECRQAGARAAHAVVADVSSEAACLGAIQETTKLLGGLDVLVLNHILSGVWDHWGKFVAPDGLHFDLERIFRVNTFSYIHLASFALAALKESRGAISVVSSTAGKIGLPKVAPYAASKHALHGFFDSLRHELVRNETGISVTLSVLGSIDTEAARHATGEELKGVKRQAPRDAAVAIIAGTQQRRRQICFPYPELGPLLLVYNWLPDTLDALIRSILDV